MAIRKAQAPFIWVFSILQVSTIRPLSLPTVADDSHYAYACWGCGNPVGDGPRNWSLLLLLLGIVARDRRQSNPVPTRAIVATSVQSTSSSSANLFNKVCFSLLFKNVSFCWRVYFLILTAMWLAEMGGRNNKSVI